MSDQFDIGIIFRESGPGYRVEHKVSTQQAKVMRKVSQCRTPAMGSHVSKCNECGHIAVTHNSCRNRHCPKCQGFDAVQWVEKVQYDLLPVRYFHVVFTIPDLLNRLVLVNQKVMYDLLFKASSDTIKQLAADKKHLGIEIGMLAVLHTWGQNLMDHPHIHMLVPAGGLDVDTGKWVDTSKKFFIPVKVVSAVFKGKFLGGLKQLFNNQLKLIGNIKNLALKSEFKALLDHLYAKDWVVYTKKTFKSNVQILRYLGRYTHRIAISNSRIKNYDGQTITFDWKDYKDHYRRKQMILDVHEFIRRFLLHVLPYSYHKIRYYGLFSLRNRLIRLNRVREMMLLPTNDKPFSKLTIGERVFNLTGIDITQCPCCKTGLMVPVTNALDLRLSG